ncbi:YceI family protein [Candidatus Gracilibacteria bacterium]|nr:YceI family protein [Candidatus Gracilibacteria bacterium]
MKRLFTLAFLFVTIFLTACERNIESSDIKTSLTSSENYVSVPEGNYVLDLEKSFLYWEGAKIVGGSHEGYVPFISGESLVDIDGNLSGVFTLDMDNLLATDTDSPLLLEHLKGPDFFNTNTYPQAKFTIISRDNTNITGILHLKGLEKSLTFPISITEDPDLSVEGSVILDRNDWGIGNAMLKNEIPIRFELSLIKKALA